MTTRRITVVASELLGRPGTGGAGTADSLLAVALARHGHDVELLVASGREIGTLSTAWTRRYDDAGVTVRVLAPTAGIRPAYLAAPFEVLSALREAPPDVVVADDWRGLAYPALRARQAGRALTETAFVVYCHGPGRVLTAFAEKVPDTIERFGEQIAEQNAIRLADAVVSPSEWLLGWMRAHDWPVPGSARVIQYLRESVALETPALRAAPDGGRIRRLSFFGQLREGKGIRIFLAALRKLDGELTSGLEVVFLGSASKRWPPERIVDELPEELRSSARVVTSLEREQALDELRQAGTLAVMPSLLDNSPNTVAECVECGIPFIASATGGIPELVAEGDRERVLFGPTADDLAATLERVLTSSSFAPARPARSAPGALDSWLELVDTVRPSSAPAVRPVTQVAVVAAGEASEQHARRLAERTHTVDVEVVRDASRRSGLARTTAAWVVFLDDDDRPLDDLLDVLVAAQASSGADVVTAAVHPADDPGAMHLFLGDPGPLGLSENQYGVLGLVRAELAVAELPGTAAVDPDWTLFARLALAGARIVALPEPLSTHLGHPGRVDDVPGDGLSVLEAFERPSTASLTDLPQFAATLAAALARESGSHETNHSVPPSRPRSIRARLRRG
jgi:glycosyltransferase involved in cell wall biosynthesis